MNKNIQPLSDLDLWPGGLLVMDGDGMIIKTNATLRTWLGQDSAAQVSGARFVDILTRASRIFFETHLRPILIVEGAFSEVSLELERPDGSRFGVYVNAERPNGQLGVAYFCLYRNEQRQSFERELVERRRESDEFRILVDSSPHAIVSSDRFFRIHAWNPAAEQLFGYSKEEVLGQRFDLLLIPEDELDELHKRVADVIAGEVLRSETLRLHRSGQKIHVERSFAAIRDENQTHAGFVTMYSDISERKKAETKIETLLHEINHRSKNLLSIVEVIARQTARSHAGDEFLPVFSNRLRSLASNQDILLRSGSTHVDLEELARAQFTHLEDVLDTRAKLSGPPVHLNESVSQAIGMAIFELVTNTAKYGALSQENGGVKLTWEITTGENPDLKMYWLETNGPPVTAPTRTGFGSQVTGLLLESTTSGETRHDFATDGLRWSFTAPVENLT
ncbi:sensor histidine kinase [Neptunicoccus sediminis]|uniref:sensor histidine kinase n=1 Tax=Neptunicoccus sediminis TaxID=1892596 RepID=UPI000845E2F6|nr:PAS domain S-box protein [Neptunicoccus sediminis]